MVHHLVHVGLLVLGAPSRAEGQERMRWGPTISVAFAMALLVGISIWWELTLWQECRATNSWLYCVRILGK